MKYLCSSLFLVFSAITLFAQSSSKESVEKLITLRQEAALYKTINAQYKADMQKWVRNSFRNKSLSPGQQKMVDDCARKAADTFDEMAGWEKEKEIIIQVLQKNNTQKEVDYLITVAENPESQLLILKNSVIWQEVRDAHHQYVIAAENVIRQSIAETTQRINAETTARAWPYYVIYGLIAAGGLCVIFCRVKVQYAEEKAWVCLIRLVGYCVVLVCVADAVIRYFQLWHYWNGNLYVTFCRGGSVGVLAGLLVAMLLVRYVVRRMKKDRGTT